MTEKNSGLSTDAEDVVLQQQFVRAITSFEAIILSQIDIKNKLADRLNYSIRAGIIILGFVAISILILLLTLSSQINRISSVVSEMNQDFYSVAADMARINGYIESMEKQVALLNNINGQTAVMDEGMATIARDLEAMRIAVDEIGGHLGQMRGNLGNISVSMDRMDIEVMNITHEMHRMGGTARSVNKMMPFLP
ncbi:MAG: translation initiation factor 2 [Chromatiaceae bacterium]|nr:translation initiation factor 2 [Gammaproteobacteria bacterium]MCB1903393.1 translation initiation factor 2 [Gammaproteobacteria bacterium]MCP5428155.1 translation initiation factor 2 [Chromatiaceae bacterium]MCP5447069.1 translation initiation factor 2 [Chromatiaceae bacterium]